MEGWDEQWAWLQGTWANRVVGHALALGRKVPSQCLEALWKPSCLFPRALVPRSAASTYDAFVHFQMCPAQ